MFTGRRNTCRKVQGFPVLYNKRVEGFTERDVNQSACQKVAESLDFVENCNFITASCNREYSEDSCSEKLGALFCVLNSSKLLVANLFDI